MQAAEAAEVSVRCARKWVGRYRAEGELGLLDRSSASGFIPHRTSEERVQAIATLRRLRFTGPEIAETLGMSLSTVSGILTRIGMGKLGRLGLEPAVRYERQAPGELIHIDINKKLGRIERGAGHRVTGKRRGNPTRTDPSGIRRREVGWEYVHIAIDDCTRLAYAEVLAHEKAVTVVAFLRRAITFYECHGMSVQQLLTDNASGYRSLVHAIACRALGIRHLRPRPYRPQTTARPSASSAPCSAAGPTARSTAAAQSAQPLLTAGSGITTIEDDTQPSATNHPSPASTSEPTYSGLTRPFPPRVVRRWSALRLKLLSHTSRRPLSSEKHDLQEPF
jgi:Integrase core domain/leucine-zipper of insertion element IS481